MPAAPCLRSCASGACKRAPRRDPASNTNPTLTLQVHPVGDPQCVVYIDHAQLGLTETEITYYAKLSGDRTRDNPSGIVRRIHDSPWSTDEAFGRDLQWHPTEYLRRYWCGAQR